MILSAVYLALALLLLLATLAAVFPGVYGGLAHIASLPGMALGLFAPYFVVLGVLLTALVYWTGALRTPLGELGLLLHLLSWALLGFHALRVYRARPLLHGDAAFLEAAEPDGQRIRWLPMLTRRTPAMKEVEVLRDIVYREVDGVRLRLDVYRPRDRSDRGPCPPALYIHGGAWIGGNRRQSPFMLYELAAAGWVVFAIAYRRAPRFPLPAGLIDCKAAVAWVREHALEYGARGAAPVVLGGSAGGHLTAMLALTPNQPRFQPGFEHTDTRIRAAVVLYGFMDFERVLTTPNYPYVGRFFEDVVFKARYRDNPDAFRALQPATYVPSLAGDTPPILFVHGQGDRLVPIDHSRRLYERLRAAGATQVYRVEVPHALHAFEVVPSLLHQRAMGFILRFLDSVKGSRPAAPA